MNELFLREALKKIDINLDPGQVELFANFFRELLEWNKKFNLTAIEEEEKVIIKHFYDSLLGMKINEWPADGKLLDLGTGAGFPGIPLKIVNPGLHVTLVDSLQKRIAFLNHLIKKLQLDGVEAVHARAEDLGRDKNYRESYDLVASRAVAQLAVLTEYCLPLVRMGGNLIAYKGPEGDIELKQASRAVETLGGQISEIKNYCLPLEESRRMIIVIKKIRTTPEKYPRRAGIPPKKPL